MPWTLYVTHSINDIYCCGPRHPKEALNGEVFELLYYAFLPPPSPRKEQREFIMEKGVSRIKAAFHRMEIRDKRV